MTSILASYDLSLQPQRALCMSSSAPWRTWTSSRTWSSSRKFAQTPFGEPNSSPCPSSSPCSPSSLFFLFQRFFVSNASPFPFTLWWCRFNRQGWLRDSPQAKLKYYNPLVMSKLFWTIEASRLNPWKTDGFLFIDGGHLCHNSGSINFAHQECVVSLIAFLESL
jgi:hypothetical protein